MNQFGLWFTSVFGSGSIWIENSSKLSQKNMVKKNEGTVHDIYTIPWFCYLVTKCING